MHMVSRMLIKPRLNIRVLMRCIVVHDEVDIEVLGNLLIDVIERLDEFFITMAWQAFSDRLAVQNVKRSKRVVVPFRTFRPVKTARSLSRRAVTTIDSVIITGASAHRHGHGRCGARNDRSVGHRGGR